MSRISHKKVKNTLLKNQAVKTAYNELAEEYHVIEQLLDARLRAGKTQREIAESMQTTTSAISRLESLQAKDRHSPSIRTLQKYAHAVGCYLNIRLVQK